MNDKLSLAQVAERRILRVAFGYALLFSSLCFFSYFATVGLEIIDAPNKHQTFWAFVALWGFPALVVAAAKSWLPLERRQPRSSPLRRVPAFATNDEASRLRARRWSRSSLALPLMSLPLVVPISIHFLVSLVFGASAEFESWILMSMMLVGHAHVALAIGGFLHAKRKVADVAHPKAGVRVWILAVFVASIPGGLLFLIPPVIVALSGIFIPSMYRLFDRAWEHEEDALT